MFLKLEREFIVSQIQVLIAPVPLKFSILAQAVLIGILLGKLNDEKPRKLKERLNNLI